MQIELLMISVNGEEFVVACLDDQEVQQRLKIEAEHHWHAFQDWANDADDCPFANLPDWKNMSVSEAQRTQMFWDNGPEFGLYYERTPQVMSDEKVLAKLTPTASTLEWADQIACRYSYKVSVNKMLALLEYEWMLECTPLSEQLDAIPGVDNTDYDGHFGPQVMYTVASPQDVPDLHALIDGAIKRQIGKALAWKEEQEDG